MGGGKAIEKKMIDAREGVHEYKTKQKLTKTRTPHHKKS